MEILHAVWAFCLLSGTLAASSWPNVCTKFPSKENFNKSMLQGKWYIRKVWALPKWENRDILACGIFTFALQEDGKLEEYSLARLKHRDDQFIFILSKTQDAADKLPGAIEKSIKDNINSDWQSYEMDQQCTGSAFD